jgi:hypothetical protein
MNWCCPEFTKDVETGRTSGFGLSVVYFYLAKSGKWFILQCYCETPPHDGSRIYFCPWCGTDLADWPKVDTKESISHRGHSTA